MEVGQHRREEVGRQAGRGPQGQAAPLQAQQVTDGGRARLTVGQDLTGPGEKSLAGAGEHHLVAGPVEQGRTELVLERGHRAADRGLGHVQAGGGAGEPAFLGHAHHVAKLMQLHVDSLCLS